MDDVIFLLGGNRKSCECAARLLCTLGGKVILSDIISHRLLLSDAARAYDIFKKKKEDCVKVVLKP